MEHKTNAENAGSRVIPFDTVLCTDWDDINKSLQRDSEAYRRLVEKYQAVISRAMWRFSRDKTVHEELVEDVFVESYLSLGSFKGRGSFEKWLLGIATHVGYRFWKTSKKHSSEAFSVEELDNYADKTSKTDPAEAAEILYKLLSRLKPAERLVLTLRYLEDCSVEETAKRSGWTQTRVKVTAWRAMNKLKKLYSLPQVL